MGCGWFSPRASRVAPAALSLEGEVTHKGSSTCRRKELDVEDMWAVIETKLLCTSNNKTNWKQKNEVLDWRSIHLYVASVYEEFAEERTFLSNHIFPELVTLCQNNHIHLIPVDLRLGLNKSPDTTNFAATCIQEIKRYNSSDSPLCFIVLLSERLGYEPSPEVVENSPVLRDLDWVKGISLLEMEIIQAAFVRSNPNALFIVRDSSFISRLPVDLSLKYTSLKKDKKRMDILKSNIQQKYPDQVFNYSVNTAYSNMTGEVKFSGFENYLSKLIVEFLLIRMKKLFASEPIPIQNMLNQLEVEQMNEMEECSKQELVGKQSLIEKINAYIENSSMSVPLVVVGETGSGKTTILAHVAKHFHVKYLSTKKEMQSAIQKVDVKKDESRQSFSVSEATKWSQDEVGHRTGNSEMNTRHRSEQVAKPSEVVGRVLNQQKSRRFIPRLSEEVGRSEMVHQKPCPSPPVNRLHQQWIVFYHSVGPIPSSPDLRLLLQRVWSIKELGTPRMSHMPLDIHQLQVALHEMLPLQGRQNILIILDSIDRVKGEYPSNTVRWLPARLPKNVKVVISLQPHCEVRKILNMRDPCCLELVNGPLNLAQSKFLLNHVLHQFKLTNYDGLTEVLLNKHGISCPQYIWELCKVLHQEGRSLSLGRSIPELARVLPNDLSGLYDYVMSSLEEIDGRVMIATSCLLYCSQRGLQEVELLDMLGLLVEEYHHHGNQQKGVEPGDPSGDSLKNSSDSFAVSTRKLSTSDIGSWSGSENEGTSPAGSMATLRRLRGGSADLRGGVHPSVSGFPSRLKTQDAKRKISSFSLSSSSERPPENVSLLLPSTPDFTKFGHTPSPDTARHGSFRLSPSLSPSPITPTSAHPPITINQPEYQSANIEILNDSVVTPKSSHVLNSEDATVKSISKVNALQWATFFQQFSVYLRRVGEKGHFTWTLNNRAVARTIYQKYFKHPPTQSFPFLFSTFCGAVVPDQVTFQHFSASSRCGQAELRTSAQSEGSSSDLVQKRFHWWHARLAWYFQKGCRDVNRKVAELPFHLSQQNNIGKLVNCLSSLSVLHQLSAPERVLELLYYWKCVGITSKMVASFSKRLASLEVSGASPQELVTNMKLVATLYHKAGASDNARQLLSDALDVVDSKLEGKLDLVTELLYLLVNSLSDSLKEQMSTSTPQSLMEPVYRVLKTGGRTIELLRKMAVSPAQENLPSLLLLMAQHLQYYALHGGSAELTAKNATLQAREALREAADLFAVLHKPAKTLSSLLLLCSLSRQDSSEHLSVLDRAERVCLEHFGEVNPTMAAILKQCGEVYETQLQDHTTAQIFYQKCFWITSLVYGEEHAETNMAAERLHRVKTPEM